MAVKVSNEIQTSKATDYQGKPTVLILGTGTIAYPFAVLLRRALPEGSSIFVAKKSPIPENVGRIDRLRRLDKVGFAVWKKDYENFKSTSFEGNSYEVDATVEEISANANLIMDCTGADVQDWAEELLSQRDPNELRGIAVEGSIKGFGPYLMYGVTDSVLDLSIERKIQIPSCNTHCLTSVIWALSNCGRDTNALRQVICFIDRRNQDKGKAGSAVHTLTYEVLKDAEYGTHQAKDAASVLKKALGDAFPMHLKIVSHAQKSPQPFMHATYFAITVEGEWTREMVHNRLRSFVPPRGDAGLSGEEDKDAPAVNTLPPFIAFTDYFALGQVYEEYCVQGLSSRGYDYAVVIANQTQVVSWPCGKSCQVELPGETSATFSTIMLSTLTPQEGNVIISNLACALKFLYPSNYRSLVNQIIADEHLLFEVV